MEIAERIGKTAFDFNLVFSLLITIIGVGLLANGVNPGEKVTGLFLPLEWLYDKTLSLEQTLPGDYSPLDVISALGAVGLFSIVMEFIFMMLSGFLVLVYTISSLLPSQLLYLALPLYVLGTFIQLMEWIYLFNVILTKLSSLTPLRR